MNGGTLNLGGTTQSVGNLTGTGGTILNNTTATNVIFSIGTGDAGGGDYKGVIADHTTGTGTVALTKTGTGMIALSAQSLTQAPRRSTAEHYRLMEAFPALGR